MNPGAELDTEAHQKLNLFIVKNGRLKGGNQAGSRELEIGS